MVESVCSCCKLFGKPPARVNFIISTGAPYSVVHKRVEYLLKNYSEASSYENDSGFINYRTLMDISDQLYSCQNNLSPVAQSISTEIQSCCHGFTNLSFDIDNISDSSFIV